MELTLTVGEMEDGWVGRCIVIEEFPSTEEIIWVTYVLAHFNHGICKVAIAWLCFGIQLCIYICIYLFILWNASNIQKGKD